MSGNFELGSKPRKKIEDFSLRSTRCAAPVVG
jgi:hypothetical protein